MTAEPTAAEIEAAARALCGKPDGWQRETWDELAATPGSMADAYRSRALVALAAALPLVEARLRAEIAGDIEAVAPPAEPEIGRALYGDDMYGNGMRAAARIARGK